MTLVDFINDTELVVASISGITTDVLGIFMDPPLVFFVGLVVFGKVAYMIRSFLRG